jgi:hypothetical protein
MNIIRLKDIITNKEFLMLLLKMILMNTNKLVIKNKDDFSNVFFLIVYIYLKPLLNLYEINNFNIYFF